MKALVPFGLALALSTPAQAALVCVAADVDYDDSDLFPVGYDGPYVPEDYYAENGARNLRGLRVLYRLTGAPSFSETFTDVDGTNAGCALIIAGPGQTYEIKVQSRARIDDHDIDVVQSFTEQPWEVTLGTAVPLSVQGQWDYNVNPAAPNRVWNVLAAAAFSLHRRDGNLDSVFDVRYLLTNGAGQLNGCSASACVDGTDIYLDDDLAYRKFAISYGMARAMLHYVGLNSNDTDASLDNTWCGNGPQNGVHMSTIEHDSSAAVAGLAYLYAATVWNRTNEADCTFVVWDQANWDLQGATGSPCYVQNESTAGHIISCSDGPTLAPRKNQKDYCKQVHVGNDPAANTTVPLDWVRFFWERQNAGDETFASLLATFQTALSNPGHGWAATGTDIYGVLVSAGGWGTGYDDDADAHGVAP